MKEWNEPKAGERWRHKTAVVVFDVIEVAYLDGGGGQRYVVYRTQDNRVWTQDLEQWTAATHERLGMTMPMRLSEKTKQIIDSLSDREKAILARRTADMPPTIIAGDGQVANTLDRLAHQIVIWQCETFPSSTALSAAKHLRKEVDEVIAAVEDAYDPAHEREGLIGFNERLSRVHVELADVFHLLVAVASKVGRYDTVGPNLVAWVSTKFAANLKRKWGEPDADGVVEHDRSKDGV